MKKNKIIYWISTGLLTAITLMIAGAYIFDYETISQTFIKLGYPTYIIYPLAILKLLGITVILTNKYKTLKKLAYVGFLFDFALAIASHLIANVGGFALAVVAIILLVVSYIYNKKLSDI